MVSELKVNVDRLVFFFKKVLVNDFSRINNEKD